MNTIGQAERETQKRVINLFHDELGFLVPTRCVGMQYSAPAV